MSQARRPFTLENLWFDNTDNCTEFTNFALNSPKMYVLEPVESACKRTFTSTLREVTSTTALSRILTLGLIIWPNLDIFLAVQKAD